MKITFEVIEDGNTYKVLAGQADLIAMERKYDVAVSVLSDAPRMEFIAFVAWNAAKRQGLTTLDFDKWIEASELSEIGDEGND